MKVLVIGAGVVGVTSAYYLARAGHEVIVLDRQPAVGRETSFANAGQVSPGYASPWAAPGIRIKALRWLMMRHRPFVVWPMPETRLYGWLLRMLAECNADAYRVNKERMLRLAQYSRQTLADLRAETGLRYEDRQGGTLQVFRTQAQLDHVGDDTKVLDECGIAYEVLDRAGCVAAEPGLSSASGKIVGGLRLPGDETGDAYLFTQRLAEAAGALGVTFRLNVTIAGLSFEGDRVSEVRTDAGPMRADAYVVAAGSYSPALVRPLGIRLPIYPVKGYSLTLPITDPNGAPVSTVMDETYKIAITRFDDRIRVGGTAELAGFSRTLRAPRRETLAFSVGDLFPNGGDLTKASFWTGLRPMTPDGTPVVGSTPYANLFLNSGHGTLGWTMACGSARVLADLIDGRAPAINAADLGLARYGLPPR